MDAVRNRGLRIPDDISVVGFDNIPQSAVVFPSLTTVEQPLEEMGRGATQMLLRILKKSEANVGRTELPTRLVARGSSSAPKGRAG
jgi:LacI family transcriptional regulator